MMAGIDTTKIIGLVAEYEGDGHPHLRGYTVKVMQVVKRPGGDPDAGVVYNTNDELSAAGGFDPDVDIIEVVAWLGHRHHRWGCVPSDVRLADLQNLRETR